MLSYSSSKSFFSSGLVGMFLLLAILLPCIMTLPWSLSRYDIQHVTGDSPMTFVSPAIGGYWFGTDSLGRSLAWRCLLGGAISMAIAGAAAVIALCIGVAWGTLAGYLGGKTDALLMRIVDVLYGLPYVLLVVLFNLALRVPFLKLAGFLNLGSYASILADLCTLLIAIASVSWLTMARVIRGQVLSLRSQPFIQAAHASGIPTHRIVVKHILPNLVGPIVVYATLTIPSAMLQESFLSFLGIGVQPPLPSWGSLASQGLEQLHSLGTGLGPFRWWVIFYPCALLACTLLSLNLLGEALRNHLDPKHRLPQ